VKCPHCNSGIYEGFTESQAVIAPQVNSRTGEFLAHQLVWNISHLRCPECHESIIFLKRIQYVQNPPQPGRPSPPPPAPFSFMAFPSSYSRAIPPEVPNPYRQDFVEACKVLTDSPKASAALSRRCLQAILRDKAQTKSRDLADQIDEVIKSGKVPSHIEEGLHAVRQIGNFAAHVMKSTATGVILDVEPGEAEWNLEILESLFDFYFVQPAVTAKRKAELNKKLKAAGKPELP
jgi:hypothetical protein